MATLLDGTTSTGPNGHIPLSQTDDDELTDAVGDANDTDVLIEMSEETVGFSSRRAPNSTMFSSKRVIQMCILASILFTACLFTLYSPHPSKAFGEWYSNDSSFLTIPTSPPSVPRDSSQHSNPPSIEESDQPHNMAEVSDPAPPVAPPPPPPSPPPLSTPPPTHDTLIPAKPQPSVSQPSTTNATAPSHLPPAPAPLTPAPEPTPTPTPTPKPPSKPITKPISKPTRGSTALAPASPVARRRFFEHFWSTRVPARQAVETNTFSPLPPSDKPDIQAALEYTRQKTVFIAGITRDNIATTNATLALMESIGGLFKNATIGIYENDSKDGTDVLLRNWRDKHVNKSNIHVITEKLNVPLPVKLGGRPKRSQALAKARNKYLGIYREHAPDADFMVIVDCDLWDMSLDAFLSNFTPDGLSHDWSIVGSNGVFADGTYYDTLALRTEKYNDTRIRSQGSAVRKVYGLDPPWHRVTSVFGGVAIYRGSCLGTCEYSATDDCEHINFNKCVRENDGCGNAFMNPTFMVDYQCWNLRDLKKHFPELAKMNPTHPCRVPTAREGVPSNAGSMPKKNGRVPARNGRKTATSYPRLPRLPLRAARKTRIPGKRPGSSAGGRTGS